MTMMAGGSPLVGWSPPVRAVVFALASTSIGALLAEFYGLLSMRLFALAVFGPAMVVLAAVAIVDRGGTTGPRIAMGLVAGLIAAVVYDVVRVPFVFSDRWGLGGAVPRLDLFKVFPMFGAMLLGGPVEGPHPPLQHALGWTYHFSNGASFGVMYLALIGDGRRRHWLWAVVFSVGLEAGMLFTPYPGVFGITVTPTLVAVTLGAHLGFGVVMGLCVRWRSAC